MNPYEMVVLYHPDLEIDIDKALKKVASIIADNNGKIVKTDNWGKRKLAYTINKQDHAMYVYYDVELTGESVSKIESVLNITDEVLRYLIVKPGPEIEEDEKSEDSDKDRIDASEKDDKKKSSDKKDTETKEKDTPKTCLLYTSPSPRDATLSRMPSSA